MKSPRGCRKDLHAVCCFVRTGRGLKGKPWLQSGWSGARKRLVSRKSTKEGERLHFVGKKNVLRLQEGCMVRQAGEGNF